MTYRVILTGSRWWTQSIAIRAVLGDLQIEHGGDLVVVHGACPTGADALGDLIADEFGIRRDPFAAYWDHCAPICPRKPHRKMRKPGDVHHPGVLPDYCPGAGPRRNLAMAERGAREFVAFAAAERSFGTANMIKLAREHGIGGRKWVPGGGAPVLLPALARRGAA
ncbi:SLOG family protein [Embleya sp. NPDC005971]|uniref:SLOG family protein n=1 Tax=Embleya sp. NPDC005971 TaxID=3156724 RepID=UPI0033F3761F